MIPFGPGQLVDRITPGSRCEHCGEVFDDTDTGFVIPSSGRSPVARHRECMIRCLVGGVNHQQGRCTCCGGTEEPDPPSLSKREAARVAAMYFRLHFQEKTLP